MGRDATYSLFTVCAGGKFRLQLEKTLTEKITQVEVQATEINTTGERIKRLQTQLWKKEVGIITVHVVYVLIVLLTYNYYRLRKKR